MLHRHLWPDFVRVGNFVGANCRVIGISRSENLESPRVNIRENDVIGAGMDWDRHRRIRVHCLHNLHRGNRIEH